MKNILKLSTISLLGFAMLAGLLYLFLVSGGMFAFMPNPPEPEIKYREFECELVYEIEGEITVIKDVIVCEFDGYKTRGAAGKRRQWKTYLKSGRERLTLLNLNSQNEINMFGQKLLELYFYYGNAEYYMGDEDEYRRRKEQEMDHINYLYQTNEGIIGSSSYSADEVWNKYSIRLISWECMPPIENTFH